MSSADGSTKGEPYHLGRTLREWGGILEGTIGHFCTAVAGVENEKLETWGCGTCIAVDGHPCVLTAHHVLYGAEGKRGVLSFPHVGLLFKRGTKQRYYGRDMFAVASLSEESGGASGPDLAALILPELMLKEATDQGARAFYNLEMHSEEWKAIGLDNKGKAWAIAGAPSEKAVETEDGIGMEYQLSLGSAPKRRLKGGFDLLDFRAKYEAPCDPPESFAGYSGGGLWALRPASDGKTWRPTLMGVTFYELKRRGDIRYVRCHGPSDIYDRAYEAILAEVRKRKRAGKRTQ